MAEQTLIDKCFKDTSGKVVLFQMPNFPIVAWFVAMVLDKCFDGRFGHTMGLLSFGALFTWAWLELFEGVNYFRKTLGLVVLILIIWSRF